MILLRPSIAVLYGQKQISSCLKDFLTVVESPQVSLVGVEGNLERVRLWYRGSQDARFPRAPSLTTCASESCRQSSASQLQNKRTRTLQLCSGFCGQQSPAEMPRPMSTQRKGEPARWGHPGRPHTPHWACRSSQGLSVAPVGSEG